MIFLDRPGSLWIIGITFALLALVPLIQKMGAGATKAEKVAD
jgi:hypothetical protein